jgi:hypothetical protein
MSIESENIKKDKEEINKEGWEGNAAVLIGKKEELEVLRERLEKEGRTADLGTYIRLYKEILLSQDDPEMAELKDVTEGAEGLVFEKYLVSPDGSSIRYVDREGNVASVSIDARKIAAYRKLTEEMEHLDRAGRRGSSERYDLEKKLDRALRSELGRLGFSGEDISMSESEMFERGNFTEEGKKLHERVRNLESKFREAFEAKKKRLEKAAREQTTKEFDL